MDKTQTDTQAEREAGRLSPEEALEQVRRHAGAGARGRLRIYLGMAPGVGKTYAMLYEGQRRKARGTDVAIGFVETYGRPETEKAIGALEIIPRRYLEYRGVVVEEMDTDAILQRHPQVALVDELAHTNVPGSKYEKRWQDVEELLDAGVTVLSTLNIQHLESLKDLVEQITGVVVRETIPDRIVDEADEIELIDMAPHALRQRLLHGNVYPPPVAQQALTGFFREGNLTALRELALRRTAQGVDEQLERYMRGHAIAGPWPASERVMVCIDDRPLSQRLLRRAYRIAQAMRAPLVAVTVEWPSLQHRLDPQRRQRLETHQRMAEDLGAEIVVLHDDNVADALIRYAREHNVDQLVIGHSTKGWWPELFHGSVVRKVMQASSDIDVHVIGDRGFVPASYSSIED
ncbi:MAG: universal stress protein [Chloroflexi bacterium]|nr:universal stress protein [Chloroflexota bacterium]